MITLRFHAIDNWKATFRYPTLAQAQAKAQKHLGKCPEFGMDYAVSQDGIVTVRVEGCSLEELFQ